MFLKVLYECLDKSLMGYDVQCEYKPSTALGENCCQENTGRVPRSTLNLTIL